MAQLYNKDQQTQLRTFNSNEIFNSSNGICHTKRSTYMDVLDTFKRIFKGMDINNLHA